MLPGQVISPRTTQGTQHDAEQPLSVSLAPAAPPAETPAPTSVPPAPMQPPTPPAPPVAQQPTPSPAYPQYATAETPVASPEPPQPPQPPVAQPAPYTAPILAPPQLQVPAQPVDQQPAMAWSASEFIRQEKGGRWYAVYVAALVVLSIGVYLFTKDVVSTVIVGIALLGLLFLSLRKPKMQDYSVEGGDLTIGRKLYYLHDFKSFSVLDESSVVEVTLLPLKRFMPPVSVYVPPDRADELTAHLADYLSFEPRKADMMDTILRRIRF